MTPSADHSRTSPSPVRLRQAALLSAIGVAAAAAVWLTLVPGPGAPASAELATAPGHAALAPNAAPAQAATVARRIYPHSVVPGGVTSRDELAQAIKSDKIVAAHYAGFKVEAARPVKLAKARAVYVSYRKGEQIFWTRHKVMLDPGETLLSDGTHDVRARCANRISDVAQLPVAADEPSPELLDSYTEDGGDSAAMQELAAPETGGGQAPVAFRLVTFTENARLAGASPDNSGTVLLSGLASSAGDSASQSVGSHSGSLVRVSGENASSTGTGATSSPSSQPADGAPLPPPAAPAADAPAPPLLPLVTPTLPAAPLPGLDSGVGGPPSAGPEDVPTDVALDQTPGLPLPGRELPPLPPFDPERPTWLPPAQPPAESERQLPHGEVPEPGTFWLFGAALTVLVWRRRQRPCSSR